MFAIISDEKWKTEIEIDCDGAYRYKILRGDITYMCCGFIDVHAHTFMANGDGDKCPKCGAEVTFSRNAVLT